MSRQHLTLTTTMPAGTYRVGDPCYSIPEDRWLEWLHAADFENQHLLKAPLDGHLCLALTTAWGDGSYTGSDGFSYGVDAGLIGLVPVEVVSDENAASLDRLTTVVTFDREITCTYHNGVITLGHLTIDTDPVYEDEEPYPDPDTEDEDEQD